MKTLWIALYLATSYYASSYQQITGKWRMRDFIIIIINKNGAESERV